MNYDPFSTGLLVLGRRDQPPGAPATQKFSGIPEGYNPISDLNIDQQRGLVGEVPKVDHKGNQIPQKRIPAVNKILEPELEETEEGPPGITSKNETNNENLRKGTPPPFNLDESPQQGGKKRTKKGKKAKKNKSKKAKKSASRRSTKKHAKRQTKRHANRQTKKH